MAGSPQCDNLAGAKGTATRVNNKDGVLFPRKIDGYYYLLHRPMLGHISQWSINLARALGGGGDPDVVPAVALGVHARASEVLMAYCVSQALALIPITPGGLGFVESGLTTLLVLVGVTPDQAVVGTLLYRLIAFWMPIPLGALAWAGWRINLHLRRPARPTREVGPED